MTVPRPPTSGGKPGARDRQRQLELAIGKYELLLVISRTKNPDFVSLDQPQLILRLAGLAGAVAGCFDQRTTWQIALRERERKQPGGGYGNDASNAPDSMENMLPTLQEALEKTRRLYQLPEVANSKPAVQGEVQVLLETGELLTFCEYRAEAMAAYAEAIRLCYRIEDEATEATLTSQLQKLQRHADALARVESLVTESTRDDGMESERRSFKAAFDHLATPNGLLLKNQLKLLAKELGTLDPLSDSEVDEIWKQLNSKNLRGLDAPPASATSEISFERLWRWWNSEAAHELVDSDTAM